MNKKHQYLKLFIFALVLFTILPDQGTCALNIENIAEVNLKDQKSQLPDYIMMDLGTLGADESRATAINDKGQVLGWLKYGANKYCFLWDKNDGIKIIDTIGNLLNNKGQITGTNYIWDPNIGAYHINIPNGTIKKINENWQGIGELTIKIQNGQKTHAIFWDRGNVLDLTEELGNLLITEWRDIRAVHLNNNGQVVLRATETIQNSDSKTYLTRSFLWQDGIFKMILPEKTTSSVSVRCIDDHGNMIVNISNKGNFLLNSCGTLVAHSPYLSYCKIINSQPTQVYRLPGELKKDLDGQLYYSQGAEIRKLIEDEGPFYNVSGGTGHNTSTKIRDQNSSGVVVGDADTFLSGRHAFIAFPKYKTADYGG